VRASASGVQNWNVADDYMRLLQVYEMCVLVLVCVTSVHVLQVDE